MTCEACLDATCTADGRTTQRKDCLSGEEVEYQYDSLQRRSSAATNRITNTGMSYDANGNLTAMPGLTMTYGVKTQRNLVVTGAR